MILAACGTSSKLKYAEKLYTDKSYAEAAKVSESIKGEDPQKYKILALSHFEMLHMDKAVEAFSKVTGTIIILQKSHLFWLALVLCVTACFCGDLVLEYIKIEFTPNASDFIRNFVSYKKSLMSKPD
jgi:hypothetical protein